MPIQLVQSEPPDEFKDSQPSYIPYGIEFSKGMLILGGNKEVIGWRVQTGGKEILRRNGNILLPRIFFRVTNKPIKEPIWQGMVLGQNKERQTLSHQTINGNDVSLYTFEYKIGAQWRYDDKHFSVYFIDFPMEEAVKVISSIGTKDN